jgi:hypothetical protein
MYYNGSKSPLREVLDRVASNGIWLTLCKETAKLYATDMGFVRTMQVINSNPLDLRNLGWQCSAEEIKVALETNGVHLPRRYYDAFKQAALDEEQDDWFVYSIIDGFDFKTERAHAIQAIRDAGFDSLLIYDTHYLGLQSDSLVIFDETQIQIQEEETYQTMGN